MALAVFLDGFLVPQHKMHCSKVQKSSCPFYEILFIEKEKKKI